MSRQDRNGQEGQASQGGDELHGVDPGSDAEALLQAAYSLKDDREAQELYARWAQTYDDTMLNGLGYLTPAKTARLLSRYLPDEPSTILDVGSGTGLAGEALSRFGNHVIDALDYSRQMLAMARARGIYRNMIEADLNQPLDLPDNSWDAMICTGTFTHAHVGADCLHELFRILKPGGVFAATVHRDVFEPQGFAKTLTELEKNGVMKTVFSQMGTYYQASGEPEGWYLVWQKT